MTPVTALLQFQHNKLLYSSYVAALWRSPSELAMTPVLAFCPVLTTGTRIRVHIAQGSWGQAAQTMALLLGCLKTC